MIERRIVLVAGMHRSGTSALTRAINLAGVPLPGNLFPPDPDNTDGFWEPIDVVSLHNRILQTLKSEWHDFREIPPAWFNGVEAKKFGIELTEWIERELSGKDALLVKDPRVCRLLPLWQKVCSTLDIDLCAVIAVRNPIEVARSLNERNKFPSVKSTMLWLRHFIDAERFTRGHPRCFVDFDDLMKKALSNIRRIAVELKFGFPVPDSELGPLLDAALKPSLRHHAATHDDLVKAGSPKSPPVIAYQWALDAAAGKYPPSRELDEILHQLSDLEKGHSINYSPSA